jgi:hypothetical protein
MRSRHILWAASAPPVPRGCSVPRGPVTLFPALKVQPDATVAEFDDRHPDEAERLTSHLPRRWTRRARRLADVTARTRPISWRCSSSIRRNRVGQFANVRTRSVRLP